MNKKGLSVVMAGAMLATSVAPVLAAPVEMGTSQIKLVQKKVTDLVESGKISGNAELKKYVNAPINALMDGTNSVYGVKVLNKDGKAVDLATTFSITNTDTHLKENNTLTYKIDDVEKIFTHKSNGTDLALTKDMTVQVVEMGHAKFLGQIIPGTGIKSTGVAEGNKFKSADFTSLTNLDTALDDITLTTTSDDSAATAVSGTAAGAEYIESVKLNETKTAATITLKAFKNLVNESEGHRTIEIAVGSPKLNFNLPVDAEGENAKLLTDSDKDVMDCVGFIAKETYQPSVEIVGAPTVKEEYKLVDDSAKYEEETLLASDLYDGLALTAKGTEIQLDIKNAEKEATKTGNAKTVELALPTGITNIENLQLVNGVANFTVRYFASHKDNVTPDTNDKPSKVITIKSTNLEEIKSLYKMLTDGSYEVGVVAGANRYETAVNVAKAQGLTKLSSATAIAKAENNIVLVNGTSLVDGLAAAPLAAKLGWAGGTGTAVLLSKSDSLPTATKEYLEELTSEIPASRRQYVTINLVGGESVLSESLVAELEDMGFSVERYGGANREETSLEVATAVKPDDTKGVFVVGANGEADAMSIAAVAAKENTPIIVAKAGGLSNDAIKFIKNNYSAAADGKIAVIGGEKAVSKAEYDKIDAVVEHKVDRVSGENRFETNAKIIEKYAKSFTEVILVKDGQANKDELIDALSSANYAAKGINAAPIVLATDKITDAQKVAILNKKGTVAKLTQVGQGVSGPTLEAVAEFLGLSNVK